MSVINQLDELIKSVEESLLMSSPMEKAKKAENCEPADELKKPKDKAQKADAAAPPKPPRAKGAPKEHVLDYSKINKPKSAEVDAPTISYSQMADPVRSPGANTTESNFKTPKEKKKPLTEPKLRSKLMEQRRAAGFTKSEDFGKITESLTKSMRAQHSDGVISEMLKAAVDANQLHANVVIEWINYRTINPAVMSLVKYEHEVEEEELEKKDLGYRFSEATEQDGHAEGEGIHHYHIHHEGKKIGNISIGGSGTSRGGFTDKFHEARGQHIESKALKHHVAMGRKNPFKE